MDQFPNIVQAVAGNDFTVFAYCGDGAVRLVDVKPLIAKGGVFTQIADPDFFRERLTILNDTVAWDIAGNRAETACVDLDPYEIYASSPIVEDPLETMESA